jgi:hypothetical protein
MQTACTRGGDQPTCRVQFDFITRSTSRCRQQSALFDWFGYAVHSVFVGFPSHFNNLSGELLHDAPAAPRPSAKHIEAPLDIVDGHDSVRSQGLLSSHF